MLRQALQSAQRAVGGEVAAHSMDATAGRRRCRADEEAWMRSGVRIDAGNRTREELPEVRHPAGDRAADIVGVVVLQVLRSDRVARENAIAEAGSKALHLLFDGDRKSVV